MGRITMIKEIYRNNVITVLIVMLVIVDAFLLLGGIPFLFTEASVAGWALIVSALIFTLVFVFLIIHFKKLFAQNIRIMQMGYKVSGRVADFGHEVKRKSGGGVYHRYWLDIEYMDRDGINKIYTTPSLGFCPQRREDVTCDIYIYEDKVFATNFVNLYK